MRARLLRHEIGQNAALYELRIDLRRVAEERDADRLVFRDCVVDAGEGAVQVVDAHVDVTRVDPLLDPRGVDLDREAREARHRRGEGLRAAHAAEAGGEGPEAAFFPGPRDVRLPRGDEGLVGALQDALGADVDPRAGRHLPVHREAERLEAAELGPVGPVADEVRVRDEHARRVFRGAEAAYGLARLHEQRLVVREIAELANDHVERLPRARRFSGAAVDDEILRTLGDLGIEVVVEHAERSFLHPAFARQLGTTRRTDDARRHGRPPIGDERARAPHEPAFYSCSRRCASPRAHDRPITERRASHRPRHASRRRARGARFACVASLLAFAFFVVRFGFGTT